MMPAGDSKQCCFAHLVRTPEMQDSKDLQHLVLRNLRNQMRSRHFVV
jgi:hypothetical protein